MKLYLMFNVCSICYVFFYLLSRTSMHFSSTLTRWVYSIGVAIRQFDCPMSDNLRVYMSIAYTSVEELDHRVAPV
jgi:hypothetical protein